MVTFRNNNNRRTPFRSSNNNRRPPFRRNDDSSKFQSSNFQRKMPSRNNNNAPKLIEKYNDLAREALAKEDKILSENYYQHADHFTRVLNEQENNRVSRINTNSIETNKTEKNDEEKIDPVVVEEDKENKKSSDNKTLGKESAVS
tara:strand:+ start:62 stop:496 length:435 start_codon:yes stop_codon:yes gene_type:complete